MVSASNIPLKQYVYSVDLTNSSGATGLLFPGSGGKERERKPDATCSPRPRDTRGADACPAATPPFPPLFISSPNDAATNWAEHPPRKYDWLDVTGVYVYVYDMLFLKA